MPFARFFRDRSLQPHLALLVIALAGNLAFCARRLAAGRDYLEALQLFCTILILAHWLYGAAFYYYYFRTPDRVRFYLLDAGVIALLTLGVISYPYLYLWYLFTLVNYAVAVLMYRVKPLSPHYSPAVQRFARAKSTVDLAVLGLLSTGMILDVVNRLWVHQDALWRPFGILTTTVLTVGFTVWILAFRLYDLSRPGWNPLPEG